MTMVKLVNSQTIKISLLRKVFTFDCDKLTIDDNYLARKQVAQGLKLLSPATNQAR